MSLFNNTLAPEVISLHRNTSWMPACSWKGARIEGLADSLVGFSIFTLLVNIVHIVILSKLPMLKNTSYFYVLVYLSAADLHYALYTITRLTLNHALYFQYASKAAVILYDIAFSAADVGRYIIMAAASLERYIALCRPMEYSTSRYVRKIHIWLPLLFALSFAVIAVRDGLFHDQACFDNLSGPSIRYGLGSSVYTQVGRIVPTIVTGGLLTCVFIELLRMRKRNVTQAENQVKNATHYLLIVIILFYVCLLPQAITYTMYIANMPNLKAAGYYISTVLFSSIYGCLNTVVYGWMTPAYRQRARMIFRWKNIQTAPNTNPNIIESTT